MKTNNYVLSFLIAVMTLTACKKYVENPAVVAKSTAEKGGGALNQTNGFNFIDTIVYVSGEVTDSVTSRSAAVYWKNGLMKQLSSPNTNCFTTGIVIGASVSNVYVSGYYETNAGVTTGVYWVNGVEKRLPDNTIANGIAVTATGSVYVAGAIITNGFGRQAAFWKDGVEVPLAAASRQSNANGIFISGTDVYIAGDVDSSAVYWKNGVATNLSRGLSGSAQSIFSDGTVVYAAGSLISPIGSTIGFNIETFWKDGALTELTDASTPGNALAIAVGGPKASTYIVGSLFTGSTVIGSFWQDGVLRTIPGSVGFNAVSLSGNDVYIAGSAGTAGAAYWKNGVRKILARNAEVSGIQAVTVRKPVPVASLQ